VPAVSDLLRRGRFVHRGTKLRGAAESAGVRQDTGCRRDANPEGCASRDQPPAHQTGPGSPRWRAHPPRGLGDGARVARLLAPCDQVVTVVPAPRSTAGPTGTGCRCGGSRRARARRRSPVRCLRPPKREGVAGTVVLVGIAQRRRRWAVVEGQGSGASAASAHGGAARIAPARPRAGRTSWCRTPRTANAGRRHSRRAGPRGSAGRAAGAASARKVVNRAGSDPVADPLHQRHGAGSARRRSKTGDSKTGGLDEG
jgi:hypothetical protein